MKTNNTSSLRRLAIIVSTVWVASQAPAMAQTAPAVPAQPTQQVKAPAQPQVFLASLSCTRVGNRMVC